VALLVVTEIGYRQGHAASATYETGSKAQLSTLQSATLGLLALLLAFTFAMAESRFEVRRELVVAESNAISSAYLRSQMLPQPYRDDIANLLRNYVDARIEFFEAKVDPVELKSADDKSRRLQRALWTATLAAVQNAPTPVPTGLFVASLGDLLDVYQKRQAARENHVPEVVLWLLFCVTVGSMEFVGYVCGVERNRSLSRTMVIAVLLSLVILVIVDLDRPRRGFIEISQQSMLELRQSLNPSP
jgi:hypothetical protein